MTTEITELKRDRWAKLWKQAAKENRRSKRDLLDLCEAQNAEIVELTNERDQAKRNLDGALQAFQNERDLRDMECGRANRAEQDKQALLTALDAVLSFTLYNVIVDSDSIKEIQMARDAIAKVEGLK